MNENLTKAEKVAKAREEARNLRETRKKKEASKKLWVKILAVLVPIVIIVIVAIVVIAGNKNSVDRTSIIQPANATANGVIVGKNDVVVKPDTAESPASATPSASASKEPAKVVVYQDYICPACKMFETQTSQELKDLRDSGKATVEYRFVTFLDDRSAGTNYSSRAANVAACIVNQAPDKFYEFNKALYEQQPAEGSTGLPNQKMLDMAKSIGVTGIDDCVKDGTYRGWVANANKTALDMPLTGTPTILINGNKWDSTTSLTDAVAKG